MASISKLPGGRRMIQFMAAGTRKTIRLGKVTQKQAEHVRTHVERILASQANGLPLDQETAEWLRNRAGNALLKRLARVGLVASRPVCGLAAFIDRYLAERTDLKESTRKSFSRIRRHLVTHFGADREMHTVTPADADRFVRWLRADDYAQATIGRSIKRARHLFKAAMRAGLVQSNPFEEIKAPSESNDRRKFFVTPEISQKVLAACPDDEWRLIFALCRYGGIRCPSELEPLTWDCVEWSRNRILIRSPKTEHLANQAERYIPIFPELRPYLEAVRKTSRGKGHLVSDRRRFSSVNLRTQLCRILRRAKIKPWPRLFQNLRASRETELAMQYPLHIACAWIGNSAAIAAKHYLQIPDDIWSQAAGCSAAKGAARKDV